MTGVQTCALPIYLLLVSKLFSMAGPPNNIPLRANGYLESAIGLINTLTLTPQSEEAGSVGFALRDRVVLSSPEELS